VATVMVVGDDYGGWKRLGIGQEWVVLFQPVDGWGE